jgi:protein SFI1
LQRWRNKLSSRQLQREHAVTILGRKRLKRFLDLWINKLNRRRQEKWRQGMRMRMKVVRDKREARIQRDAWANWRRLYHLFLAAQMREQRLLRVFFSRWRQRLEHIDRLDMLADETAQRGSKRLVMQNWSRWKRILGLSLSEKLFVERRVRKTMKSLMAMWGKQTCVLTNVD